MSSLLVYAGLVVIALWILSRFPLLGDLLIPLFQGIGKLIEGSFRVMGGWILWVVRRIIRAHYDFVLHLRYTREEYDPSEAVDD